MAIKAVVFDANGAVILPWRFAGYPETIGITRLMTREFFQGVFEECLLGKRELRSVHSPPIWMAG